MPTSKTNLVSYQTRDVSTRYGDRKVTDFNSIEGVKFFTWNAAMASQVKTMLNQPVIVEYEEQLSGDYKNYKLLKVAPVNEFFEGSEVFPDAGTLDELPKPSTLDKDIQIARAVALKAAVVTPLKFSSPDEVIALAKVYEGYLNGD